MQSLLPVELYLALDFQRHWLLFDNKSGAWSSSCMNSFKELIIKSNHGFDDQLVQWIDYPIKETFTIFSAEIRRRVSQKITKIDLRLCRPGIIWGKETLTKTILTHCASFRNGLNFHQNWTKGICFLALRLNLSFRRFRSHDQKGLDTSNHQQSIFRPGHNLA